MKDTKQHFTDVIEPLLPENSVHILQENIDDYCLNVNGKIMSDESRPNKPAKRIRIIISQETVEDYAEAPKRSQDIFDEKLIKFIKTKVESFDPEHDKGPGLTPPDELWQVPFGITY